MDYKLNEKNIAAAFTCLDTVSEQPVDLELILPDYCPDIEKILKCSLTTQIFSRSLTGGQLVVDGVSIVHIMYIDSIKKNIRCCEQTLPFSSVFNLNEPSENYIILIDTKTEYINCRALSPRKLVLHGAFSLYAKVICKRFEKIYEPTEESQLEIKTEKITCNNLTTLCQEQFSVSDDISAENKPPIEAILNKKITAYVTDVRLISGKIMINGDVNLKLLYLSDLEAGEPQQLDYMLPFSQVIDCEDVNENTDATVSVQVLSSDVRLKSEMLSEATVVSLDVKLIANVLGYNSNEYNIVTDAYSTKYETELEFSKPSLLYNVNKINETIMEKNSIDLGDTKISKIIDLYNDNSTVSTVINDDGISVAGKANVCILALDEENYPVYFERMIDFEHLFQLDESYNAVVNPKVTIKSMSYRLSDTTDVDLRCEIQISIELQNNNTCRCVSKVFSPDEKEIKSSVYALTLYYAQKDESLWNIAKRYNTKLCLLTQENNLDAEILEKPQMLLIPSV